MVHTMTATDWHWYSGKATNPINLKVGSYNAIPPLAWTPDISGQGQVVGYLKATFTLRAGFLAGKVRRQLVRAAWQGEPVDPTWYDDWAVIRTGANQRDLTRISTPEDWLKWLPPWDGEIVAGRSLTFELKPSAEFASFTVTTRYLKAYILNELD